MRNIILSIITVKHIGTKEIAKDFFRVLERYDLLPDKINNNEPVTEPYSLKRALELWTFADGIEPGFRLGWLIGKKNGSNIRFDVWWHIGERARVNRIELSFTQKDYRKYRNIIEKLFKDLIICFSAIHGYITEYQKIPLQYVPGSIEDRMDGIFWCNYYGNIFVLFFGKEKILNASWHRTEMFADGGIITYLAKEPDDEVLKSNELEMNIVFQLGRESFGDMQEYKTNLLPQKRHVPKIDFSEIRKPISYFDV